MRELTKISGTIFLLTIILYYFGRMIPIQVSSWFRQILAMLGLINTFGLTILIFNYKWVDEIKSKIVKGLIWGLIVLVVGHNFIWTSIQLNIADYKDDEIIIIDKVDQRRKTITQHRDDGVFGDYYRTVTVYELTSFLRIIENEKRN